MKKRQRLCYVCRRPAAFLFAAGDGSRRRPAACRGHIIRAVNEHRIVRSLEPTPWFRRALAPRLSHMKQAERLLRENESAGFLDSAADSSRMSMEPGDARPTERSSR